MAFPSGFVWGAAASSYQIEGATTTDGRGPSIWDSFCRVPGAVVGGHTGEVACDHYHRMVDDVALMKRMGLKAYRFSIAWPRVLPAGVGAVNDKGLDFYSRLVDELLKAGITPYPTLFHWDYPEALYQRGGWLNRETAEWFAEYTRVVVDRLSDRVDHWMTLNEPQVFIKFGHGDGTNAPGLTLSIGEQLLAAHHALLAHGQSVQVIRARAKRPARVGWAVVCVVKYPHTNREPDVQAARHATCGVIEPNLWNNSWWNDPVFLGHYPEDGLRVFGDAAPRVAPHDMAMIRQPLDFLGLNIYEGQPVTAGPDGRGIACERAPGHATSAFRWPVEPESLYWGPRFMHERYGVPIAITENGISNLDWVDLDGQVRDPQRIDFTRRYLRALRRAGEDGVNLHGYFHWSLMDNFEWAAGYRERFGLVHVDYTTQERRLKESAHWYRGVIEANGTGL